MIAVGVFLVLVLVVGSSNLMNILASCMLHASTNYHEIHTKFIKYISI
jgi:hypothetical protein